MASTKISEKPLHVNDFHQRTHLTVTNIMFASATSFFVTATVFTPSGDDETKIVVAR